MEQFFRYLKTFEITQKSLTLAEHFTISKRFSQKKQGENW